MPQIFRNRNILVNNRIGYIENKITGKYMEQKNVFIIMIGICGLVLFIGLLKQKAAMILNIIVRIVVGCVGIILLNDFLQKQGIPVSAGLNTLNLLTIGGLGTSGFALIYGILFYSLL